MKKFVFKVLLYSVLPVIWLAVPIMGFMSSGEYFVNIDKVIESTDNYLIGYSQNETSVKTLKWKMTTNKVNENKVIVIGSSTALQFRENMFDVSFFNGGFTIRRIGDFAVFMESLPDYIRPEFIIITLDIWMFNLGWDGHNIKPKTSDFTDSFVNQPSLSDLKSYWSGILNGENKVWYPMDQDEVRIGINAVRNDAGFRNDGSMHYGSKIRRLLESNEPPAFEDTRNRVKQGANLFKFGDEVDLNSLEILGEFLQDCTDKGIKVVALIPPLAERIKHDIEKQGKHSYMKMAYPLVLNEVQKYGHEMYNFQDSNSLNWTDTEMLDGFHGGELVYQKMLIHMLENGSSLNEVTDVERLRLDLCNAVNRYIVYDY